MFNSKDAVTALEFAAQVPDLIRSARGGSLIEYTRPTRVEPMTLVDLRAASLPYIDEVLNAGLNVFSAYYLQAVSLAVNVGNVNVLKLLDRLNPNRNPMDSLGTAGSKTMGGRLKDYSPESFAHGLPFAYSQEAEHPMDAPLKKAGRYAGNEAASGGVGGKAIEMINEAGNLSLGKLLEVKVESDGQTATFPIQVRLMSSTIRPDHLAHTLSLDAKDVGVKERYHQWRSGQIKFWKDIVFAQDLIEQHKKNLMNDASGFYKSQHNKANRNKLSGLLSGNPSVATASAIVVMTTETAKDLESRIRRPLKDFRAREKVFHETNGMMFFIIDPDWEQVTIYHRSIEEPTEVSVRELQRANKRGGGPDILEILNAFRQSKSPTL